MKMRELTVEEFQQAKDWVVSNILGRKFDTSGLDGLPPEEIKHRAARYDAMMAKLFPLPQEDEEDEDGNSDQE